MSAQRNEPAEIVLIWKAKSVKENGVLVYTGEIQVMPNRAIRAFRLDLTSKDQVNFFDIDGRKLVGQWSVSTDNNRLILENLSPPPKRVGW